MRSLLSLLGLTSKHVNRSVAPSARQSGALIEGLESRELFSVSLAHATVLATAIKATPTAVVHVGAGASVSDDGELFCGNVPHFPIHFGGVSVAASQAAR